MKNLFRFFLASLLLVSIASATGSETTIQRSRARRVPVTLSGTTTPINSAKPTTPSAPTIPAPIITHFMAKGDYNKEVFALQEYLRSLGIYAGQANIAYDDTFGAAINTYLQKNGGTQWKNFDVDKKKFPFLKKALLKDRSEQRFASYKEQRDALYKKIEEGNTSRKKIFQDFKEQILTLENEKQELQIEYEHKLAEAKAKIDAKKKEQETSKKQLQKTYEAALKEIQALEKSYKSGK